MSECRNCVEGSITSRGVCDLCGFNELQFVEEWENFSVMLDEQHDENLPLYVEYLEVAA